MRQWNVSNIIQHNIRDMLHVQQEEKQVASIYKDTNLKQVAWFSHTFFLKEWVSHTFIHDNK